MPIAGIVWLGFVHEIRDLRRQ